MVRHTSRDKLPHFQNPPVASLGAPIRGETIACRTASLEQSGPKASVRAVSFTDEDLTELITTLYCEFDLKRLNNSLFSGTRRSAKIVLDSSGQYTCSQVGHSEPNLGRVEFVAQAGSVQFDDEDMVEKDMSMPESVEISVSSYEKFKDLMRLGDYFNACHHLCISVEKEAKDIPIRDSQWFLQNKVPPPSVVSPSPAYDLPDWSFSNTSTGLPSPNFWTNCQRVVESACATLNLLGNVDNKFLTQRERKQAFRDVAWNPYVIYVTNMKDSDQAAFEHNENYFRMLYLVRQRVALFGDYGYKSQVEGFIGEGASTSNLAEVFERVKAKASELKDITLSDVIDKAVDSIWGAISGILELITNAYRGFLVKVRSFLKNFIIDTFDLRRLLEFCQSPEFKQIIFMMFCWFMLIFFVGCYVISYNTAYAVAYRMRHVRDVFVGEADIHPATFVTTLVAGIFGLTTKDENRIMVKARYLCTLVAGGTVAANLGACCFSLLPEVLKDALEYKFGTKESQLRREINQWRASANALIHLSTVPRVVSSEVYISKVKEMMSSGSALLNKTTGNALNSLRSACLMVFVKLQKIHMNIVQFINGAKQRDEPFCVHIFGRPGIGKSTLEKKLQARAFGIMPHESYPMSFDDEYHSGYMNQRSVVIDEFLEGPIDLQEKTASVFLKLKSSARVKLDMPTIDNVFVGVKGSEFDSELIITMSNTAYPRVASFNDSALQRRRDVVVEFEVAEGFEKYVLGHIGNKKDAFEIEKINPQAVRDVSWVKARCLPKVFRNDFEEIATPWMTFDVLCEYLQEKYAEKKEMARVLSESMSDIGCDSADPMDLINEELRKTCSLPSKPVGVLEALSSIFASGSSEESFVAEAGPRRHYCKCPCGFAFRHRIGAVEIKCQSCGASITCTKGTDENPFSPAELAEQTATDDRISLPTCAACTDDAHFHSCLNPLCKEKRGCNSNRSSLNWVCNACTELHGDKDPSYWAGWAYANRNGDRGNGAPLESTFSSYEDWQQCCAERVLHDLGTVWDALPLTYETVTGKKIIDNIKSHVLMGLALGAMFGMAKWLSTEDTPAEVTFQPQSDPRRKVSHKSRPRSKWTRGEDRFNPEAKKNIQTARLDVGHCAMVCIPLASNWVLTFAHGLFLNGQGIQPGTELGFYYNDQHYKWKCEASDFILSRDEDNNIDMDIAFVRIGDKRCPAFKNVISCFLSDDEFPESKFRVSLRTRSSLIMTYATRDVQNYSYEGTRFTLSDGFRYDAQTSAGDCGTPVLMASGDHITKCAGIHVAGSLSKTNPVGLAVRVSREMIEDAIGDLVSVKTFVAESCFLDRIEDDEAPNLVYIEQVPFNARVHISDKSKLKASCIAPHLPFVTTKQPAILSQTDPRSQGKDPVEESIVRLVRAPKVELEQDVLDLCAEDLYNNLKGALDYSKTGGFRELTFEEALFGIPGALASVTTSTNAGSPYCYFVNKTGKKELVWFEGSEGKVSESFRRHVLEMYQEVKSGQPLEKVFLGFQKDEVRSKSKIESVNTRLTYSNDVTYNVVCRMLFGAMIVAFNTSFPKHAYALGINPSSHDANKIFHRLRKHPNRLVAGDFSEFDLRHQRQIMDKSFKILEKLGEKLDKSDVVFEHVRLHETEVPFLIGKWKLRTECNNASGGFWTTILNCITCDLYFRYAFRRRFPGRVFDHMISMVILGDDHIVSVNPAIEWNPLMIREDMKPLGQVYTSAVKDRDLEARYESFTEVLFLGNYFVSVGGSWSGALRKSTLEESVLWTRNSNRTIVQECQQMVEFASQWDEEYYKWYLESVNAALQRVGLDPVVLPPWSSLRRTVAERTTENSTDFRFVAQADNALQARETAPSVHVPGLVTIDTSTDVMTHDVVLSRKVPVGPSISETPGSMQMGTESFVRRGQWNWTNTDSVGGQISGYSTIVLPYGLLGLGDQSNIQNMGFQNFQFSQPDIEIKIQLNGSPTQAGCLMAVFVPFRAGISYLNMPGLPHVKLSPCDNTTGTLKIPYRFWRTMLDNQFAHDQVVNMGFLYLTVYSPLVSNSSPQNCGVTVYSRFKTTQTIPRTLPPSRTNTRPKYGFTRGTGTLAGQLLSSDTTWVAQGGNVSTTNVQNTYSVGDVAGNMPIEGNTRIGGNTQSLDQKADVSAVPLDNPPVVGGGIPVVQQFPSMSKTNGPESTTGLYLHPQEMFRQPFQFRDSDETRIDNLLARPGRLFNFSWSTTQADGADLYSFDLDSLFFDDSGVTWAVNRPTCANIAILNMFRFAHFDTVFSVHVVRTRFHSGRLQATVSYSMFDDVPAQKTALYNNILDFNGDSSVCEFRVPWNASQEFIRTNENKLPGQSSRIGTVSFSVLNELRVTSEVVSTSVDVIIEIRFENVRVAMPNPYPVTSMAGGSLDRLLFVAQSEGAPVETSDINRPEKVVSTTAVRQPPPNRLCKVNLGQKFEYEVGDVHEVVRRYTLYPAVWITNVDGWQPSSLTPTVIPGTANRTIYRIPCEPPGPFNGIFSGWSGMQKFRIYAATSAHCTVSMSLATRTGESNDNDYSHVLTLSRGTIMNPGGVGAIQAPYFSGYMAREVMYPLGSQSYIDVSVPFSTEFNFLPTFRFNVGDSVGPRGVGYLYVNVPKSTEITVYWAAGDDFRYHVYSPSATVEHRLGYNVGGAFPVGNFQIAGVYATPT